MVEITIEEISEDFPAYLRRAEAGESFIVVAAGKAIAEIKPAQRSDLSDTLKQLRQICQEEDYALEIPSRNDRLNSFLDDPA
jgi:antitoxin (DNA-binding transcriptional repressor) of toxin-antitoxin stability system